jgi:hypothetical protein
VASHPDWKPWRDAGLCVRIQQGGPTDEFIAQLRCEGWFPPAFSARTSRQAKRAEVRRHSTIAQDDRALPLFLQMTDALADDGINRYLDHDGLRHDEGKLRQGR